MSLLPRSTKEASGGIVTPGTARGKKDLPRLLPGRINRNSGSDSRLRRSSTRRRQRRPTRGRHYYCGMVIEVPWKDVPVSEPVLPGEESAAERREKGFPVYTLALVSTIAGMSTSEARRQVEQGRVIIDGVVVPSTFIYLKPGALLEIGPDLCFRIGVPEDAG
jgi:hypothetical protein